MNASKARAAAFRAPFRHGVAARLGAADGSAGVTRIEPPTGRRPVDLRELWAYRELLYFLVWRDVKVRYRQTLLGASWAVARPVLAMVVFTLIFGRLAGIPSEAPYALSTFAALVPWTYFAAALSAGGTSLVNNRHLISKVYFPRLMIPLAATLTPLVDFAISLGVLLALMVAYGVFPGPAVALLPLLVLLMMATALAASLTLAALNVRYRDVGFLVGFLTQFWLYVSPVAYPASLVPERWRPVYGLNPLAGVIEGFRWALLGTSPPGVMIWVAAVIVALGLAGSLVYFRRAETTFADVI